MNNEVNEGTKLTKEDVNALVETLEANVDKDTNMLRELPSNQGIETATQDGTVKIIPMEANMSVNPNTGEFMPTNMNLVKSDADVSLSDIADENGALDLDDIVITPEMVAVRGEFGDLSDDEAMELFNVIIRYRKKEKFSVYNALPKSIKSIADKFAIQSGMDRRSTARFILDQFISDMNLDKTLYDFNQSVFKELDGMNIGITEIYSEHRLDIMEVKLLEVADKVEAENPEKAKLLRDISSMFTETYKMDILKNSLSNRKNRQFIKDVSNYEKVCRDFNIKYEKSRFKINNVLLIVPILVRKFSDKYAQDDIMRFVMLFCRECYLKDPNEILDHVFMYYTIQNILMVDYLGNDDASDNFAKQLLNNVSEVIDKIKELQY